MDIPPKMLANAAPEHVAFGCMPSFNVYGLEGIKKDGREVPYRTAGGHIHFGCGPLNPDEIKEVVKALDAIIGVASVSLFEGIDEARRREMYGLAGEYRTPPHGLEYRTLSNAWLCHPLATHIVFDLARQAFQVGLVGLRHFWKASEEEVIECIQKNDVALARKILKRNKDLLFVLLQNVYNGVRAMLIQRVIMKGIASAVENPNDIISNWNLDGKIEWVKNSNGDGKCVSNAAIKLFKNKKVS
jgi:hypothetical protein